MVVVVAAGSRPRSAEAAGLWEPHPHVAFGRFGRVDGATMMRLAANALGSTVSTFSADSLA